MDTITTILSNVFLAIAGALVVGCSYWFTKNLLVVLFG